MTYVDVTISMHKLTAGSGYDYLTRQVAALDATDKGHVGLADYYSAKGESPGRWVGAGMDGIDGLEAGDAVTADQMRNLFGAGLHPLAAQPQSAASGNEIGVEASESVGRLGAPFKVYSNDVSPFRTAVAQRLTEVNRSEGRPADSPVPAAVRARIRTEVATEFFRAEHGRNPSDARELSGTIAKLSRPKTKAIAGFDLTFSPVKSVSTLWAVADPRTAAAIEAAHDAAVADALRFIEQHALFTRTGANGIRQVDVRGLVAATFVHRDSRAGDPDLHTHVAVANKVQTLDGRWRAIDGRVLYQAKVSASETYNTALEAHLTQRLGVSFAERPNADRRKRPVREIVGVDQRLNARWSARRMEINSRRAELAAQFHHDHGRPPTPVEAIQLAQQATLETRNAKHEPRSLAEQRATWRAQAAEVLGSDARIAAMIDQAIHPGRATAPRATSEWLDQAAVRGLAQVESHRSTWRVWHVRAEALRQVRELELPANQVDAMVEKLTTEILQRHSVALIGPDDGITEPAMLRRSDGTSVYTVAGSTLYTSTTVLEAERRLVETAGRNDGRAVPAASVDVALLELIANGAELDAGQAGLVRDMASSGLRLQLAIAPAGAGKTTAMAALARVWTADGGRLIGLAPSAAAAAQLRDQIESPTDTLAKLVWSIQHGDLPDWAQRIGQDTLVIIDEAGMADTPTLDAAVAFITGRGGSVRLIGDDQQLAAVGAGGVIRDIATTHGAVRLTELHRFTNRAEAAASLALREGRPEALGFYLDHQRIHVGDLTTATDQLFNAWKNDRERGLDAIMLAPTRELVAELNCRARTDRVGVANAESQGSDGGQHGDLGGREPSRRRRHDHHPPQRPATPRRPGRLGQERRPVVCSSRPPGRQPDRPPPETPPIDPATGRLRRRPRRTRLRHHRPRRPRRHRRRHARTRHGRRGPTAAVHDGDPRPAGQPSLSGDGR